MKKITILLIATLLIVANACKKEEDKITWDLNNNTLTISGSGKMPNYYYYPQGDSPAPWYEYRESIHTVVIEEGITSIGDGAFYDCQNLTLVTIPNSVTEIGEGVFSACGSLTSIDVKSENNVFTSEGGVLFNKNKSTLIRCPQGKTDSYIIPNSVIKIGKGAFGGCLGLTSITISNNVTTIEEAAFSLCAYLSSITIPNSVKTIGKAAFSGCFRLLSIEIPSGITSIGEDTFMHCESLASVIIPSSVTSIGERAFWGCLSLTSITNLNPVPIEINSSVFGQLYQSGCMLKVPASAVSAYKNAEVWKEFDVVSI